MGTSLVLRRQNLGGVQPLGRSPSQHIYFNRSPDQIKYAHFKSPRTDMATFPEGKVATNLLQPEMLEN
jgi:hypothetical protein